MSSWKSLPRLTWHGISWLSFISLFHHSFAGSFPDCCPKSGVLSVVSSKTLPLAYTVPPPSHMVTPSAVTFILMTLKCESLSCSHTYSTVWNFYFIHKTPLSASSMISTPFLFSRMQLSHLYPYTPRLPVFDTNSSTAPFFHLQCPMSLTLLQYVLPSDSFFLSFVPVTPLILLYYLN